MVSKNPTKKTTISDIHIGRVIQEQRSSEELLPLSLQSCSFRRNSQMPFLIRAAVAGWYHPNRASLSRVYVNCPDSGCVHHYRFTGGEERPMELSEEPKGEQNPFPLIASAAPTACTATLPLTSEGSVSITCSVTFFPKKASLIVFLDKTFHWCLNKTQVLFLWNRGGVMEEEKKNIWAMDKKIFFFQRWSLVSTPVITSRRAFPPVFWKRRQYDTLESAANFPPLCISLPALWNKPFIL